MPGIPATANQNNGAITPSLRFSLTLSTAARPQACRFMRSVSRLTNRLTCRLASGRSACSSAVPTRLAWTSKSFSASKLQPSKSSTASSSNSPTSDPSASSSVDVPTDMPIITVNKRIPPPCPFQPKFRSNASVFAIKFPSTRTGCQRYSGSPKTSSSASINTNTHSGRSHSLLSI